MQDDNKQSVDTIVNMNETIKISIIVPVYNTEKYIGECIDSLSSQIGAENTEIIIINDGSTDNSRVIAEEYIGNYSDLNIKLINQENKGLSNARNVGVTYATGEYLMFVDSDDYLLQGCIERISKQIDKKKYDIVLFSLSTSNESGKIISLKNETLDYDGEVYVSKDNRLITIPLVAYCKAFNRQWYIKNGLSFAEGIFYEDISLIPYALSKANAMYACRDRYYVYRQRKDSIMNRKIDDRYLDVIKSNEILKNRFVKDGTFEKYRDEIEGVAIKTIIIDILHRINAINPSSEYQEILMKWIETQYPGYQNNKYIKKGQHKKIELLSKRKFKEYHFIYGIMFNVVRYAKNNSPACIYRLGSNIRKAMGY